MVTYSGFTPLDFAVRSGNIDTVRRLLRVPGIDVDKASNLTNPLFTAASLGNLEIVKRRTTVKEKKQRIGGYLK